MSHKSHFFIFLFSLCGAGAAIAVPVAQKKVINSLKETLVVITLKKSFELQNYLRGLLDSALNVLSYNDNITVTKQEHMRKKVLAEADDEEVIKPKRHEYVFDINALVDFACYVQQQMAILTAEINVAKCNNLYDLDCLIAVNNQKRKLLERMVAMSTVKAKETVAKGIGVKFNGEGNQTTYNYDIKETTTIDFDRNKVKAIASRLRRELDADSTTIDKMMLDIFVDYSTIFEIGDDLEEAVVKYLEAKKSND